MRNEKEKRVTIENITLKIKADHDTKSKWKKEKKVDDKKIEMKWEKNEIKSKSG